MNLAGILSTYLLLNLLIAVSYIGLKLARTLSDKFLGRPLAGYELRIHYLVLTMIMVITLLHPFLPHLEVFEPIAKVWSAPSLKDFSGQFQAGDQGGYLTVQIAGSKASLSANRFSVGAFAVLAVLFLWAAIQLKKNILLLSAIRKKSFLLRRIGGVSIYANDHLLVPFSYWTPTKSDVVIPTSLVHQSDLFRIAISHELQHHRQSDTKWIYILLGLRLVCFFNPFVFLWNRWLLEIGEFACDEALIQQKKVDSLQYARCLGEVAERVRSVKNFPVAMNGLAFFLVENVLLKKRIENIFSNAKRLKKSTSWFLAGALLSLITLFSFFFQNTVQDRRVFEADALEMVRNAKFTSQFPFELNDLVLTQLNRYIGTPEGRDFMKSSLKRMEEFRVMIEGKIREYQLPMELLAVPLVESGYRNQPEREDPRFGAGIWMFIKPTAIVYGLKVDQHGDERLDPLQLTDAAMRYLKDSEIRFNNWLLAIQSFNSGVRRVEDGIEKTGSRDAWVISKLGYDNDKNYLAKVMAAILILKNPKSIQ